MSKQSPLPAFIAYLIPIVGWLYVFLFQRKNTLAVFHLRQAIGLALFLVGVFAGWAVVAYLIAIIPVMAVVSVALFSIVIAAFIFGFVAWIGGMLNALRSQATLLPLIGAWASRLPIAQ